MDKLCQDATDIEIILNDAHCTLHFFAHKHILECSSEYFNRMFQFGKEKSHSVVEIAVDDAGVAHDLILSFYGQKINSTMVSNAKYLLKMFKCRSFFCLDNDVKLLYDIEVPAEDFDLLVLITDEFDLANDERLMRTIKRNIPLDYDLNNFTVEFINELFQINDYKIISSSRDKSVKIWDAQTGQLLNTLMGWTSSINSVAYSSGSLKFLSMSDDKSIKVWDVHTGQLLKTLNGHTSWVTNIAFSSDDTKIVSGSYDASIKIWDAQSGQLLNTLKGHIGAVFSVAFSSNSSKIVSGGRDGIKIWDAQSGQLLNTLKSHNIGWVYNVKFSPDGLKIVSASDNNASVKIWDVSTGQLLNTLNGHTDWANSMEFSPDGLKIILGNHDGSIKIWDAQSGRLLNTLKGHTDSVTSITFSNPMISPIDMKLKKHIEKISNIMS